MIFKAIIGFKKYLLNQKKPLKTRAQNFGFERGFWVLRISIQEYILGKT
jgi:hypothetical protein